MFIKHLEDESGKERKTREKYKGWMQGIDVELQLLLVDQIELMLQLNDEKTQERQQNLFSAKKRARIAENIHHIRMERGILIEEMCEYLNLKETTYRNIENGSNGTTPDNYAHIAKILDVPLTLLLDGSLKNREALVAYRLEKVFSKVNFIEKIKMRKMIEEMTEVLMKYRMNRNK